ncbi:MAG: class I SAM-dependent methyltransferase [Litoreibacter sp.]|nr:class I SAM-dependent methyltransferase [Litoreibacter sp.]
MAKKPDLTTAYALNTPDDSVRLYGDWAKTYDSGFVQDMSYELPIHVADAYAREGGDGNVLDVGAGTGLVAERLVQHGIGPIDATDISPEMLEVARAKGLYRDLFTSDVTTRLAVPDKTYDGIVSAGTFTLGHVGPDAFDELLRIAKPNALFAISINSVHFEEAGFRQKLDRLSGEIKSLIMPEVEIYGQNSHGDHAGDRGKIAMFRKA